MNFDVHFSSRFGSRWEALRPALLSKNPVEVEPGYFVDRSSQLIADQLPLDPGDRILDLCSAPGGKALCLLKRLPQGASLTCNELSRARRERLKLVLNKRAAVTGHDASLWFRYEQNAYDKILLDVPCSSEAHLLESTSHLNAWSPARSRNLAIRQFALLASALEVVRPGGMILYSTCSISKEENDGVIQKLFRKRKGRFLLQEPRLEVGEATQYGWELFPDRAACGPAYFSLIQKLDRLC